MSSLLTWVRRHHRHTPIKVYDDIIIGADGGPVLLWHMECLNCAKPLRAEPARATSVR